MDLQFISKHSLPYSCYHYQAFIDNYLIKRRTEQETLDDVKYFAFKEPSVEIFMPKVCIYEFMPNNELKEFMDIEEKSKLEQKIGVYAKSIKIICYICICETLFKIFFRI